MFQFQIKLCFTIQKLCLNDSNHQHKSVFIFVRIHLWNVFCIYLSSCQSVWIRRWRWFAYVGGPGMLTRKCQSRDLQTSSQQEQGSYSLYFLLRLSRRNWNGKAKGRPPPALCSKTGNFTCFQPARFFESRTKNSTDTFMHPTT